MRNWLACGVVLLLFGCSWGEYQIPKEDYRVHIRVLGVLPVLVDRSAAFSYPQKEPLFDLLQRSAAGKQDILVERLRSKKGYFDVRSVSSVAVPSADSLLSAVLPPDKIGRPEGYEFNRQAVAELTKRNALDGLLLVVFSGAQIEETRLSRNLLESLRTRYNDIMATATVVDRNGQVLWRLAGNDAFRLAQLQYADFDEAYYNRTDKVQLKYISLSGIEKVLSKPAGGDKALPEVYDQLFERIAGGISPGLFE